MGKTLDVLVEGTSDEHEYVMMGRHAGQAPEIDGQVYLSEGEAVPGTMRRATITQASDYDVVGELLEEDGVPIKRGASGTKQGDTLGSAIGIGGASERRIGLRVVPSSYR